jgi:hypothetical protein
VPEGVMWLDGTAMTFSLGHTTKLEDYSVFITFNDNSRIFFQNDQPSSGQGQAPGDGAVMELVLREPTGATTSGTLSLLQLGPSSPCLIEGNTLRI